MEELEILHIVADTNTPEFNKDKALEEAAEFMEAVLKYNTKHKDNPKRPSKDDILKEYGDFIYRGLIYLKTLFPKETFDSINSKVDDHIVYKLEKLEQYYKEGKYKNGL